MKKNSISIKEEWLNKLEKERISMKRSYGVLAFNFSPNGENYFIITEKTMRHFLDFLKELTS